MTRVFPAGVIPSYFRKVACADPLDVSIIERGDEIRIRAEVTGRPHRADDFLKGCQLASAVHERVAR